MLASLNWIQEFVKVEATGQEIADKLSMAGLEVEAFKDLSEGLTQIETATILSKAKHPNADRLSLCEVRCGEEVLSIVCGANNMKTGDKVALAKVGTQLPGGMKIKRSKIRQVASHGMLCSESELGLAESSEGILILPPDTPEGIPLTQALSLQDALLEVNVTPNRGDCLSMQGLAREVAANYHVPFQPKTVAAAVVAPVAKVAVEVKASQACARYSCRVLQGIQVKASPAWMVQRLEACGIRAINNVVDATNYVMLETGQPLHAFDLNQVRGAQIQVRFAKKNEVMNTLDGEARQLVPQDLVIADQERVLALAGVMGGEDSGVESGTVDLLLESACFAPNGVRKTARRLGLQTESSYRFERGVDPNGCVQVLERLTQLLQEIAGGGQAGEVVDVYPQVVEPLKVQLRQSQVKRVLGIPLSTTEILPPLQALGIEGTEVESGTYQLQIPTFRPDLTREIDVIEEVARLYGYNRIPISYPKISLDELPDKPNLFDRLDRLRDQLVGWGFTEVLHYSFTSPQWLEKFGMSVPEVLQLTNPLSEDLAVMRPALFPQMVQTLRHNIFHQNPDLKLFEIRPVYQADQGSLQETWRLCLGMSGARQPLHFLGKDEATGLEEFQGLTLLDLKGYLQALIFQWFFGEELVETSLDQHYFHPKRQSALGKGRPGEPKTHQDLGLMGRLHPAVLADLDLSEPLLVAEINLDLFLTESKNSIQFQEISPFPSIGRDLNLIVDEAVSNREVVEILGSAGGPWLKKVQLYDLYRGQPLPEGKKALTYRIEYSAQDRTLTDEEVNGAREKLLKKLQKALGATLR